MTESENPTLEISLVLQELGLNRKSPNPLGQFQYLSNEGIIIDALLDSFQGFHSLSKKPMKL